jgi:hypothetical protein
MRWNEPGMGVMRCRTIGFGFVAAGSIAGLARPTIQNG